MTTINKRQVVKSEFAKETAGQRSGMNNTTMSGNPTISFDEQQSEKTAPCELMGRYIDLMKQPRITWTSHPRLDRVLGKGGQGVVFLSERRGADGFTIPIALKFFSPERFEDTKSYEAAMSRIAKVAAEIALIQNDKLLNVIDFYDRDRIRVRAMEWIDGFDLRSVLDNERLASIEDRVSQNRWQYINDVLVTSGEKQPRMKPGVAVAIVRDCLDGLAALHRAGIVHSDVKPGNIMLKMNGHAKLIDTGSAFNVLDPPSSRACTPNYAAPEVLDGKELTPRSDLASLGYVLIELLSGKPLFTGINGYKELLNAKRTIHQNLPALLPEEVAVNPLLTEFCRRLINPDPALRFPHAEAAELGDVGAAAFQRQLVRSNLSSEYANELRVWLLELRELVESE